MEEDEYKATYNEIAETRCVFEKALTNRQCECAYSKHFCLADREGYACKSDENASKCCYLLEKLRDASRFFLKIHSVGSRLPHNIDIRVQVGGLRGLRSALYADDSESLVADISALVEEAAIRYGGLDELPYSKIVQDVASYQGRTRGRRGRKND